MDEWEKKKATRLFDGLQRNNMGHSSDIVGFSTCAYVVHQYHDRRECHPQTESDDLDPFFQELRQDLDITKEQFESVYGKVAHRVRNNDLKMLRHDKYETDVNSQQTWRSSDNGTMEWL
ncbi:P1 family peptidase [Halostella sp. JP-L12]|uniref:P1 family peptidase n=1 Tax=Halostella TaxID=1843185 RepID=UPI0013CEA0D6|nr:MULTISPECIES: P1 family peptidase [Halostella]NHN48401.1 P1 family peptidase [Halostella sp. JP-L12]